MGDAHLESQNKGRTFRLKIEQSESHQEYVHHLFDCFSEWVRTPPQPKSRMRLGKKTVNWWFQTYSHSSLRFYGIQFYEDRKKKVPNLIHRWLSPVALAYWYMDDGSVKSVESKGVVFNTQGFELYEVQKLCRILKQKFGLDCKPRKQKDDHQIYVSGHSFERFRELVAPYLVSSMAYKIPKSRAH